MLRQIQTAVAAAAVESVRMQLFRAMADSGIELVAMAGDAASALDALQRFRPDLLIADAELPQMEGAQLAKLALSSKRLPVRPAAIVLHYGEFISPHRAKLEEMGAVFLEKPVLHSRFSAAVARLERTPPHFPAGETALAEKLLRELGFPDHIGSRCLKTAALLCAGDERLQHMLSNRLYPATGEICSVSAVQAERAMRHAIGLAWQSNQFENQYRIFADTVDAGRGQPTCGEMISRLADILRLEG